MTTELRPATSDDLDGIVDVFLSCWRESYAGRLPSGLVGSMPRSRAESLWRKGSADTIVAVDQDQVRGVTRFGLDEDGRGIIHSLYVDPRAQGSGVGARLLSSAEAALVSAGAARAVLWVFDANAPSIAFYHRQGWSEDGTTRTTAEFGELERRLTKELG